MYRYAHACTCVILGGKVRELMEFASSCTVDELGDYLLEKGVPPDIVTKFIGKLMYSTSDPLSLHER